MHHTRGDTKEADALRQLYDRVALGYQSLDDKGRMLEVNHTWLDKLGYSREEVIGRWFGHFLHPDYLAPFRDNFPSYLETGETHDAEMKMVRKDGSLLTVIFNGKASYDEQGRFLRTHCVFTDITAQKQAEETLSKAEAEKALILNNLQEKVVLQDLNNRIIWANRITTESFGATPEQLIGRRCHEAFFRFDQPCQGCPVVRARETGRPQEAEMTTIDGRVVRIRGIPLTDQAGQVTEILEVVHDITATKRAEAALQAERQRLFNLLEEMPGLVLLLAPDYSVVFANRNLRNYIGPNFREGDPCYKMFHNREAPCGDCLTAQVFASREPQTWERQMEDGRTFLFHDYPFTAPDGSTLTLKLGINITARKKAEAALRESEATWRALLDASPESIILIDTRGMVLALNQTAAQRLGHSPQNLIGFPLYDLFSPELARSRWAVVEKVIRTGKPWRGDDERDGIQFDNYYHPILDAQGRVAKIAILAVDVTERKRAAAQLQAARERLLFLVSAIPAVIYTREPVPPYQVTFVSDTVRTQLGYEPEDFLENPGFWAEQLHPEDAPQVFSAVADALNLAHVRVVEYRFRHKDGHYCWVRDELRLVRDAHAAPLEIIGFSQDITHEKRAEDALRKSEEQYRLIFEQSPLGVFHFDQNGVIRECNDNFVGIIGSSREQLVGFNMLAAVRDEAVLAALRQALSGRTGLYEGDYRSVTADKVTPIRVIFSPITTDTGAFLGGVGLVEDITARRQAEEALRESENILSALVESHPAYFLLVTPEGVVQAVNPRVEERLGKSAAELMGTNIYDLLPPEVSAVRLAYQDKVVRTGRPVRFEDQNRANHFDIYMSPVFDADGRVGRIAILGIDITERKRLERHLWQAQKLEAVGRLAGGIAHDFNNLLTAIIGYSDILERQLPEEEPLRSHVEGIQQAADRAATLTRQLLAFSRRQMLQPQVFNLNTVLLELEDILRRLLGEDIELLSRPAPDLGLVKADPAQMEQVMVNLAVNARDAMPQGGRLTLETENVFLDEKTSRQYPFVLPGPYIRLTVRDTGEGMDRETRAQVFDPFFTTKEVGAGTGLGLSTVYGIVKQSGGYILIESEPGLGTTATVYLPQVREEATWPLPPAEAPIISPLRGWETILVAEDEEVLRAVLVKALKMFGYRVLEAQNGMEALIICTGQREPIHLILTDVVMPKMSGPELAGHLALLRPDLKVLFMSGYAEKVMAQHGLCAATSPFLPKPFKPADLARMVREVLEGP